MVDPLLTPYSVAAVGTLLAYDYLCTLNIEIEYIWSQPFSLGTVLFCLNRYLPFVDTYLSLDFLVAHSTPEQCLKHFRPVAWLTVLGTVVAEIILMLRTYTLWQRRLSILITLSILLLFVLIPSIVVVQLELESIVYVPLADPTQPGCSLEEASAIIFIAYVLLILSETIIATLTIIRAVHHLRRSRSPWVYQLYREGILFYVYLLLISVANVVVPVVGSTAFANWLATPQRVLHSVLCNRVFFCISIPQGIPRHSRSTSGNELTTHPTDFMYDGTMDYGDLEYLYEVGSERTWMREGWRSETQGAEELELGNISNTRQP